MMPSAPSDMPSYKDMTLFSPQERAIDSTYQDQQQGATTILDFTGYPYPAYTGLV
jgi:hypothetical protein